MHFLGKKGLKMMKIAIFDFFSENIFFSIINFTSIPAFKILIDGMGGSLCSLKVC